MPTETKQLKNRKVPADAKASAGNPKLRFPGFSDAWEEKKLGEIGKFFSGQGFSDREQGGKSGTPFYKVSDMNNIGNEKKMMSANHYVTEEQIRRLKYKVVKEKSIIFAKVGAAVFLERKRIAENFLLDNNMMAFRPNINIDFVGHIFTRIRLSKYAQVGALPSYNSSDLSTIKLLIPKLEQEQQKIAGFLGAVDGWIENLRAQKENFDAYKKGMMQKIFSQEIRFKDDNGKAFSKWEEKKLGDVCGKRSSNISANSLDGNNGIYEIYGANGVIKKVDFYREELPYVSIIKDGAGVGRILLCNSKTSVLGTLEIIKPEKNVNLYFLYLLLSRINFAKYSTGSTIPHIYFKDYKKAKLSLPSLPEQQKIAEFLTSIDKIIESEQKQITQAEQWKKGLMQGLFV